ncbi:MAG: hypothetical protein B7Y12_19645 [Rhizobiales bacterium 24-66-13]|jgi:nitrogenase molybdenum-iron protein alpha/beta subunit|uniref:hypothetical protein n=1 Tax=Roseixanthobacter finlandensis TaxID=3119922 RepID=UPI000BD18C39|nr:MAG: hypothetical protein B7Y12_19645 [Rhizobiales bacterium 24-66-13]OZA96549.1 MAG: hypothetical protein B7X67_24015 [Rhizobiales bacterium 39-66-18]HQS11011.1 hypothetical protein [Xanthobacteraceae bacterium]HQS46588.1 hypothetical protein [Xanthobacteraceae bacterium]
MFGYGSHSSTADISKRLEALRNDITLLGEALAGAAEENTRTPRHEAGRYIGSAVKSLEREAASLAADGLSLARKGRHEAGRHIDDVVDHAHDLVARKPGSILLGAVVVGLTVGYVLYAMTGTPSRRR